MNWPPEGTGESTRPPTSCTRPSLAVEACHEGSLTPLRVTTPRFIPPSFLSPIHQPSLPCTGSMAARYSAKRRTLLLMNGMVPPPLAIPHSLPPPLPSSSSPFQNGQWHASKQHQPLWHPLHPIPPPYCPTNSPWMAIHPAAIWWCPAA